MEKKEIKLVDIFNKFKSISPNNVVIVENGRATINVNGTIQASIVSSVEDGIYNSIAFSNGVLNRSTDNGNVLISDKSGFLKIGSFNEKTIQSIIKAGKFVSKDVLRPAMMNVCVDNESIYSTNAHYLYKDEVSTGIDGTVYIDKDIISLMKIIDGVVDVYYNEKTDAIMLKNDEIEIIKTGVTLGKFPNCKAIIPTDNNISIDVPKKRFLETLTKAEKFANKVSKNIVLTFKGSLVEVLAEDIDMGLQFTDNVEILNNDTDFKIGVNVKLLINILKSFEKSENIISFRFKDSNKAILINDNYLLAPYSL